LPALQDFLSSRWLTPLQQVLVHEAGQFFTPQQTWAFSAVQPFPPQHAPLHPAGHVLTSQHGLLSVTGQPLTWAVPPALADGTSA
jgi:hypothetical protein